MLQNRVEVTKDTRSYLISISFTASSADEAARVVNAIAVEYLRDKAIQRKRDAVTAAEIELARQLAVNGDKHPKVLQAADELEVARAALKAIMAPGGWSGRRYDRRERQAGDAKPHADESQGTRDPGALVPAESCWSASVW